MWGPCSQPEVFEQRAGRCKGWTWLLFSWPPQGSALPGWEPQDPSDTRRAEKKGIQEERADSKEDVNERNANSWAQENVPTDGTISSFLHLQGSLHNPMCPGFWATSAPFLLSRMISTGQWTGSLEECYQDIMAFLIPASPSLLISQVVSYHFALELYFAALLCYLKVSWTCHVCPSRPLTLLLFFLNSSSPSHSPSCLPICQVNCSPWCPLRCHFLLQILGLLTP